MSIGTKMAEKRGEIGITQEALANNLGVSTPYISQIENNQKKPSYSLLIKIASFFDVSIDFFFGTVGGESKDPSVKFFERALNVIDKETRAKVVTYLFQLSGVKRFEKIPFLNTPSDYAKHIINEYGEGHTPVDPWKILSNLGVDVYTSKESSECEGILYKNTDRPVVVIDSEIKDRRRVKFTLATMIGHLVIPWHLNTSYCREKNKRSLNEEDQLSIEAKEFAAELLLPSDYLKNDFQNIEPSLENLENLAYKKYDISLFSLGHKFVEMSSKKFALITSKDKEITRKCDFNLPFELVTNIQEGSLVDDFINTPPQKKEFRKGQVDSKCWIKNKREWSVYEDSMLDPDNGFAVSLLRFTHK